MRRSILTKPLHSTGSRAALATVCSLICLSHVRAQDDDGATGGQYSLPRSQDDIAELRIANEDLQAGRREAGVERLLRLYREASFGVTTLGEGVDRWEGMRARTRRTLVLLGPEDRVICERLATREMGTLASVPIDSLGEADLLWIATQFPTVERGLSARLRLGDLALERGDALRASIHFRAADDAMPARHPERAGLEGRRQAAAFLVRGQFGTLDPAEPLAEAVGTALNLADDCGWPAYGGGLDGARRMDEPLGQGADAWTFPVRADGFDVYNPYAMHAVGDLAALYLVDGHSLHAIDPLARGVAWVAPGPMVDSREVDEFRDGINPDVILAPAVGSGLVVAALQVPNDIAGADQTRQYQQAMTIVQRIPSRRLFAFDRATGKLVWSHWDTRSGPLSERFAGHDACGAPLISGDTVYCMMHDPTGAIACSIAAYDLQSGEVRFKRLICTSQQEVNMFGNSQQEFAAGPIALFDGVLYGTTNLGVVFAVDAESGELRWISGYESIPLPPPQLQNQPRRPVYFANNPLVFADGVLATTPIDSDEMLGIEVATGRILWKAGFAIADGVSIRWLLGAIDREFIVAGSGIAAIRAQGSERSGRPEVRRIVSDVGLGEAHSRTTSIPRGAIAGDHIWFLGSDGAVRILDVRGNRDPRMAELEPIGRGNLLLVDGLLATVSDRGLRVRSDPAGLVRGARQRVERRPNDPAALLRLARLERALVGADLASPAAELAERRFRQGLAAAERHGLGQGSRVWQELARGAFELAFDRALAEREPQTALAKLRSARDVAIDASGWLSAQQEILDRVAASPNELAAEWETMAARWPDETFVFREFGAARVGTAVQIARLARERDPTSRLSTARALLATRATESVGERTVRDHVLTALEDLIREHGKVALASFEADAEIALAAAGEDPDRLERVLFDFPLTKSATSARLRLLDGAVRAGDLARVARTFVDARSTTVLPQLESEALARVAIARGNSALARGLVTRAIDAASDDPTRVEHLKSGFEQLLKTRPAAAPALDLPAAPIAVIEAPNEQAVLTFVPVVRAAGFPIAPMPLLVNVNGTELRGYRTEPPPKNADDHLFSLSLLGSSDETTLVGAVHQFGTTLVANDGRRILAFDHLRGEVLWQWSAGKNRSVSILGVEAGTVLVQSQIAGSLADDAELRVFEPATGTVLGALPIGRLAHVTLPVLSAGQIWFLDTTDPAALAIRNFDPLTLVEGSRTPLAREALAALDVDANSLHRLEGVRSRLFADAERIYLPLDTNQVDESSRIVAVERKSGRVTWRWTGLPGCLLDRIGTRDGLVVIFERSALVGRLSILGDRGDARATFDLAALASAPGWPDGLGGEQVPDPVVLTDKDGAPRLLCIALDPSRPRFQLDLSRVDFVFRQPIVGDDFLLLPSMPRGQTQPSIQVLNLTSRRSALPNNEPALTLRIHRPLKVFAHERHVVLQTLDRIVVLGNPP
ncbi:MAG: PQQ-binding-like beta-propeller repeat protein [Planctomycetota bacterium]